MFKTYGARGITFPEAWESFAAFWADMGPSWQAGLTLDRVDNNLGYSADNCRWATRLVQASNKSNNVFTETRRFGRVHLCELSRHSGIPINTLRHRLKRGLTENTGLFFTGPRVKIP